MNIKGLSFLGLRKMGIEIPSEAIGKKMKRRLVVRDSLDTDDLSIFEMDNFIYECVDEFLNGAHRPLTIENVEKNRLVSYKSKLQSFYKYILLLDTNTIQKMISLKLISDCSRPCRSS